MCDACHDSTLARRTPYDYASETLPAWFLGNVGPRGHLAGGGGRGTHIRRDPDEPETRGTWNTPLVEAGLTRDRGPARPVSSPGPTGLHSVYMTGSKSAHPLLVGFFMSGLAAPRGARHAISQTHADQP